MLTSTPSAPLIETSSSSGLATAACAAASARSAPEARPVPMSALPRFDMTAFTSAKSRFTSPGTVTRSEMPLVALSSTSSATPKASVSVRVLLDHRQQALVGDDDERVHLGAQLGEAVVGLAQAAPPLEAEGTGDHRHRERPVLLGEPGHHRRRAGAGAAAHAGGDEDHVAAAERVGDGLLVLLGGARGPARGCRPSPGRGSWSCRSAAGGAPATGSGPARRCSRR